ncbi:YdaU family protein [Bradyrhizobium pachyrhizi]|uniref:YdaU family protein n=1 Tax=Bradyrhizobium pachyrhizi TaxID=280333 RepID=UPI003D3601D0
MSQPWFPFYVGDYVRDTARLTTEGHGAYLLLMLDYWANGAPPDDDETLSSIARLPLEAWIKLRPKIAPFFDVANDKWSHGRIEKELAIADEKHRKRVEAGKAGGEAKAKNKRSPSIATSNADELLCQPQPHPQSFEKDISRPISDRTAPETSRFDEFWQAYPRRDGPNPRKPAEAKFSALVKAGLDPQMMIDAVRKLAADEAARGKVGTQFIPRATTWLNEQRWSDHAAVAALQTMSGECDEFQLESAVKFYARTRVWSRHAGPEPGLTGCRASAELLQRHGLAPDGRKLGAVVAA